jgi:hypothetical protein
MWLLRKRRRSPLRDDSLIEFAVRGKGALVMDATEVDKLRSAAADVGSSSFELVDRDGDLAISLNLPGVELSDRDRVTERFCRFAGLPMPD